MEDKGTREDTSRTASRGSGPRFGFLFRIIASFLLVALLVFLRVTGQDLFTLETLKKSRETLLAFVENHYLVSVLMLIVACMTTTFIVPGALVLSLAAGFFFGTFKGALYLNVGMAAGAVLAFLTARYLLGVWLQTRYRSQLAVFNREIERHGKYYLLFLRIVPVVPSFVINYLAGITRMPLKDFASITVVGELPGSLIFSFAGQQLNRITRVEDIFSLPVLAALALLAMLALLPVFVRRL